MISRSAGLGWFFLGGGVLLLAGEVLSLLGSTNVQPGAPQLLEEEKVQQLYLNWGSVNWLTHALI